ncbi:Bardet-Biedl syndrome 10 protein homolog [Saccostrea cucullata]|uniref:Bardet-Biedl syndrome 10 protein homolog n=1 Tax=Saccostrea cuccullata TaxID=36930 RepID=UPI002ED11117
MEPKLLDFSKSLQICKALESLVSRGFGPQGLQTLMCTSTGQVLMSNNGATIFNAMLIGHPLGRLVVDSINQMTQYTGDGSKVFILMLTDMLQQIDSRYSERERGELIRGLNHFNQHIFPNLQQHVLKHSRKSNLRSDKKGFCESIEGVLRGVISPHYSARVVESLTKAVMSSLNFDLSPSLFLEQISIMTQNFSQLAIKIIGSSISDSTTLDSYIIQRDFVTEFEMCSMECVKFVVLMCSIEGKINTEDGESIYLSTNESLGNFMKYQRERVERFASLCSEQDITLVISTMGIPKYCLQVLSSKKISVIQYVEDEDVEFLSWMCKKNIISEFPITKFTEKEIFLASSCKRVIINGRPCVQLIPSGEQLAPFAKTLLLTAPTDGLCSQLYTVVHKAIKSVYLSLNPPNSLEITEESETCASYTIPGGASFELLCRQFLMKISRNKIHNKDMQIAEMLEKAFLTVARILHRNVSETRLNETHNFLVKLSYMQNETDLSRDSCKCLGFDRRGIVKDMEKEGVLESLNVKFHVVSCVLNLLNTILKTNGIIGIKNA